MSTNNNKSALVNRIVVTANVWYEVTSHELIQSINTIEDQLNQSIDLSDYGIGVKLLAFIFVINPREDLYSAYLHYSKKHKELTIQYCLPYGQMLSASTEDSFQHLVHYFIEALESYHQADAAALNEQSDAIQNFDFTAWKEDVEKLFEAKGWLISEPAS